MLRLLGKCISRPAVLGSRRHENPTTGRRPAQGARAGESEIGRRRLLRFLLGRHRKAIRRRTAPTSPTSSATTSPTAGARPSARSSDGVDTILVAGGDGMVNSIGGVLVGTPDRPRRDPHRQRQRLRPPLRHPARRRGGRAGPRPRPAPAHRRRHRQRTPLLRHLQPGVGRRHRPRFRGLSLPRHRPLRLRRRRRADRPTRTSPSTSRSTAAPRRSSPTRSSSPSPTSPSTAAARRSRRRPGPTTASWSWSSCCAPTCRWC